MTWLVDVLLVVVGFWLGMPLAYCLLRFFGTMFLAVIPLLMVSWGCYAWGHVFAPLERANFHVRNVLSMLLAFAFFDSRRFWHELHLTSVGRNRMGRNFEEQQEWDGYG